MRPGPWNEYEEERREAQDSGGRIFAIVVSAGLAFLAGRYVFSVDPVDGGPSQAQELQSPPVPGDVLKFSAAPERPVEPPVVPRMPANAGMLNVFECFVNGQRVLSDQRCAEDARERSVVVTRPDPRDVALAQRRATEQRQRDAYRTPAVSRRDVSGRSGAGVSYGSDDSTRCANIDQRIEWINARMRQGYTSQEGEWLRDDLRALKQERWDLRCGR